MEFLVGLFLLWVGYLVLRAVYGWLKGLSQAHSISSPPQSPIPEVRTKPSQTSTYRPSSRKSTTGTGIVFGQRSAQTTGSVGRDLASLSDINDAFTGRRLDLSKPLFECRDCHVFYQQESVVVLQEVNNKRCMACGSTQIIEFGQRQERAHARNHTPDVVTLADFRQHLGHVVTFTGHVHEVKQSRRGLDYAVMFEKATWTKGLKMVAFRGGVRRLGGASVLKNYAGKNLTIRGLLINDMRFGPEIIVDDPAMILRVDR